jgi:hypothetical protein
MNGNGRHIGKVPEYIPGPPVKKHGDDKPDNPVLPGIHPEAPDKPEAGGDKNNEGGIENGEQDCADHPEQFRVTVHANKSGGMQVD